MEGVTPEQHAALAWWRRMQANLQGCQPDAEERAERGRRYWIGAPS